LLSVEWTSQVKHFWHADKAKSSRIMAAQFTAEPLIDRVLMEVLVEWFMIFVFGWFLVNAEIENRQLLSPKWREPVSNESVFAWW